MEQVHPEEDLRPQYQRLVADTHEHPDALYLLARVVERLLRRAADAPTPSAYAFLLPAGGR